MRMNGHMGWSLDTIPFNFPLALSLNMGFHGILDCLGVLATHVTLRCFDHMSFTSPFEEAKNLQIGGFMRPPSAGVVIVKVSRPSLRMCIAIQLLFDNFKVCRMS
ncbi:hypothetical protein PV10_05805 [Exophiala mesophila]|uniref:Uncharacterized protein n=1 Tax=Exophiala mesophila TaxID=212818 RepID=A0A0D1ZB78_EXOME|nr:uncharacterized protein PV10_05805 [Exophiala mesophila]KIV91244.1 hypothetical protein PV10_05805 [Exophiala mesophila]